MPLSKIPLQQIPRGKMPPSKLPTYLCIRKSYKFYLQIKLRDTLEFVTCGVELLRGHSTDIPADQRGLDLHHKKCFF